MLIMLAFFCPTITCQMLGPDVDIILCADFLLPDLSGL